MKRNQVFPSNYLGKDDVTAPFVATVADVRLESLKTDHGTEDKPVLIFADDQVKPMILNQTNWLILEDAYGLDSDDWRGKPVEIFVDPGVMFAGRRVGGVRVRIPVVRPINGRHEPTPSYHPRKPAAPTAAVKPQAKKLDRPMTSDEAHASLIGAFAKCVTVEKLNEWAAWGKKSFDFTVDQEDEQSDAYHAALTRLGVEEPAGVEIPF